MLAMLTGVLGTIADVIEVHNGTFLEFISEEVLAVFNAPNKLTNHASAGMSSAVDIHRAVAGNHKSESLPIRCRCGVHTATILAGNIGSSQRIKYGLLGDGINLAARLKGLNSRYGTLTLCSEHAIASQLFPLPIAPRPVDLVAVKGKSEPTTVYEIIDNITASTVLEQAAQRHAAAFSLYQAKRFQEAYDKFEEVASLIEDGEKPDVPSRLMMRRCEELIANPPGPGWDGVDRLTKKTFGHDSHAPKPKAKADKPASAPSEAKEVAAIEPKVTSLGPLIVTKEGSLELGLAAGEEVTEHNGATPEISCACNLLLPCRPDQEQDGALPVTIMQQQVISNNVSLSKP